MDLPPGHLPSWFSVVELERYRPNGWGLAYWASASFVVLHLLLVLADRDDTGKPLRRAAARHLGILFFVLLAAGASVMAGDAEQSMYAARVGVAVGAFIGPATFSLACVLGGWLRPFRALRVIAWLSGVPLAVLSLGTRTVVPGVWSTLWGFSPRAGSLTALNMLQAFATVWAGSAIVGSRLRSTRDSIERRQLTFVLISLAVGSLSFIDVLALWKIGVPPSMFIWAGVASVVMSSAVRPRSLVSAPGLEWRALLWLLASSLVLLPMLMILIATREFDGWGASLPTAILLFVLGLWVRLYNVYAQPRIDDLFMRRKRDLARELDFLSDKLLILHTAESIGKEVAELLIRTLYLRLVAFAVREEEGRWRLVISSEREAPPPSDKDELIRLLSSKAQVWSVSRAAALASAEKSSHTQSLPHALVALRKSFESFGAEYIVPFSTLAPDDGSTRLLGFAAFGPRPHKRELEVLELGFLERLRAAISVPLAAALIYDRRRKFASLLEGKVQARTTDLSRALSDLKSAQGQLVESEKMATLGLVVSGVASQVEAAVLQVSHSVPELARAARAYDEVAAACLALAPRPAQELESLCKRIKLDYVRQDVIPLVEAIGEGARRARSIATDLGRFARTDDAAIELVDLHRELDATFNLLRHDLKDRVTIDRHYGAEVPLVECDRGPIGQVFMNLVINAFQAIDGRGTISVRTRLIDGVDKVEVCVRDTGKGIEKANLGRIFEPFFTTKALGSKGGTGLGLSISYGIVERHGGRISVESEPGRGTEFKVVLPVRGLKRLRGARM